MRTFFKEWPVYRYIQLLLGIYGVVAWRMPSDERLLGATISVILFIMMEAMMWLGFGPVMTFNWFYVLMGQVLMMTMIAVFGDHQPTIGGWTLLQAYLVLSLVSAILGLIMIFTQGSLGYYAGLSGASALVTLPLVWMTGFPQGSCELTLPLFLVILLLIECSAFGWKNRLPVKKG